MAKYEDIVLSPAEAFDIYVEKYPSTTVMEVELESGSYVYKVMGFDEEKEYKLYINPYSKTITKVTEKISKSMFTNIKRNHTDQIQKFVNDALEDAGKESKLDEWSLEVDNGRLELKVELILKNGEDAEYKYNIITENLIKKK